MTRDTGRTPGPGAGPPPDRGAQPERTALAWSRTTLALIAGGLLCVRFAPSAPGTAAAAAVVCGGAALLLRRSGAALRDRRRRIREPAPRGTVADPLSILIATGVTMMLGLVGVLSALPG
ncbi:DUF202 domain-containing protein [Actinomadura graeca]|uniref:DUF202 domain-containing protein n=1 Tax=Actinomadura graeca TaxID=2750812 RepID=A0ABX8R2Q4_9ACTN|nr:DUF202 domain-containing protein [Actinomadura graeca]QXJ24836.1 DUF202 domain-containing protein [Actinomadura graeca]